MVTAPLNAFTWTLTPRTRTVLVDWHNGLGFTTKLEWKAKPYLTARGWREEIALCHVAGAVLPIETFDAILAEVLEMHLPVAERKAVAK